MTHKLLTDVRDDGMVEVAIDTTGSPLGTFNTTGYVMFSQDAVIVPFSGDRRAVLDESGFTVLDADDTVLARFEHCD